MNKHTDIILWLAERVTEPSCISTYGFSWAAISRKPDIPYLLAKKWKNRHILGVLLGLKLPTYVTVWLPFGMNKHTNIILWLAERGNEPSYIELWLLVGGNQRYQMS